MIELNLAERPPETDYRHIVRLEGVQKFFGAIQVVRDIDFTVGRNEIVGLIGDNGAGKSTLIKVLTGVLPPTSGRIFVRDRELNLADIRCVMNPAPVAPAAPLDESIATSSRRIWSPIERWMLVACAMNRAANVM